MFFYASKILWLVAAPSNILILLTLLGVGLLFTRYLRVGRGLAVVGALGLLILGATPAPRLLIRPLENRFPQITDEGKVDGIIIMGGPIGFSRDQVKFTEAASRLTIGMELARRHPQAKLVFTGGHNNLLGEITETEADAAGLLFSGFGLEKERIVLERDSRNTYENALFTLRLIKPQQGERWLLLTSAYHMPRSVGCFRALGIELIPYPVDYRTEGTREDITTPFKEWSNGLKLADTALKEWVGLVAYRWAGYTSSTFP